MFNDGNIGRLVDDNSFVKSESSDHRRHHHHHQFSLIQRSQAEMNHQMEMEGRGFPELCRNTSEELFIKSLMESSMGMPAPTMEMLGFKNLSQNFRTDSEELFRSWLTNGENSGYSSNIAHRTRQASRRISTEVANMSSQQQGGTLQRKRSNDVLTQNNPIADDVSTDLNQQSIRNAVERSVQASNLYLAKAWFHSSQPMTRSRSSELRKRYAAMQGSHTNLGMEAAENTSGVGISNLKQEFSNPNGFTDLPMDDIDNQLEAFMSPSNSSSSTFNAPQMGNAGKVSFVVDLLKGTLERKKLGNQIEKETVEDSSNALSHAQEIAGNSGFGQGTGNSMHEIPTTFQEIFPSQLSNHGVLHTLQGSISLDQDGFGNPLNPIQLVTISREPSQSESSAAAPVASSGFDACDGPSNSSQALSICESSKKQAGNRRSSDNGSGAKVFRERIIDNLKDEQKKGGLVWHGSETSAGPVDKVDPTKKRRVERSRKMAEAKERNLIPAVPSDMRAVLKRCENLEKEVRSLKLNLSFMNRKDSEQTKQIEELQKQNEELADEKERLLEEIERILCETSKM